MKNQTGSLGFEIQWEISVYMCFMCYALAFLFPVIQNSYAGNLCMGLKPTFGIRAVLSSRGCLCC